MAARIGSQGIAKDTRFALEVACDLLNGGHRWVPPESVIWVPEGETVPGHPGCKECVRHWKARLTSRGCTPEQIERVLVRIGVKIPKKRENNRTPTGLEAIEMNGGSYLDWLDANPGRRRSRQAKKLGSHIVFIDGSDWTEDHERHNAEVEQIRDEIIAQREQAADRGEDPLRILFPSDLTVYKIKS